MNENAIDRKLVCAFIDGLISDDGEREKGLEYIRNMPSVNPQPCEDAIDRAEAIKIASGYCHPANVAKELAKLPSVNPQEPKTDTWSIKDVADTFKKHGLIREQEPKTWHWIPVSERLPDDYGRYLISTEDGRVETINYGYTNDMPDEIAFYEWDDEEWQCWKPNVTAWMPRPKAYKAESEENKSCDTCRWNKTDKCQPSTCAMIGCDGHGLWEMAESEV